MTSPKGLTTTTIGSVPYTDANQALDLLVRWVPELPCWPQLVKTSSREDMVLQAVDGLPLLSANVENSRVDVAEQGREEALTEFYEHFLAGDYDHFAVPPEAARALEPFLERAAQNPDFGPELLKAQVIGPVSFGLSVRTGEERTLLDDTDLADTVVKGLGAKAAWLARRIRQTGRTPVIFIDEPGLTGYGSAFSNLQRDQVVAMLDEAAEIARSEGETYIGTHVCGNTDWAMLASTKIDIINFDAYGFLDHFLLYPKEIGAFLDRGGYIAWGIVPTKDYDGTQNAPDLAARLLDGWKGLAEKGVDPALIRERALITPSCGTGSMNPEDATVVHELLPQIRKILEGE